MAHPTGAQGCVDAAETCTAFLETARECQPGRKGKIKAYMERFFPNSEAAVSSDVILTLGDD